MTQWEYHIFQARNNVLSNQTADELTPHAYIARMGRAGWELVAATPTFDQPGSEPCVTYWLKRPITSPPKQSTAPRPVPTITDDDDDDLLGGFAFGIGG